MHQDEGQAGNPGHSYPKPKTLSLELGILGGVRDAFTLPEASKCPTHQILHHIVIHITSILSPTTQRVLSSVKSSIHALNTPL